MGRMEKLMYSLTWTRYYHGQFLGHMETSVYGLMQTEPCYGGSMTENYNFPTLCYMCIHDMLRKRTYRYLYKDKGKVGVI
jgi:hypothetical protein